MQDSLEIYIPTEYQALGTKFFSAYDFEEVIVCPEEKMKGLKPKA